FVGDGIARDLTDLMSDGLHSKILPEALARTTYEDRIYSVPNDLEPLVLHYRRDLFQERGYEVPTTWAEFAELGRRIRDESDTERIANFPTNGGTYFAGFVQQQPAKEVPPSVGRSAMRWVLDTSHRQFPHQRWHLLRRFRAAVRGAVVRHRGRHLARGDVRHRDAAGRVPVAGAHRRRRRDHDGRRRRVRCDAQPGPDPHADLRGLGRRSTDVRSSGPSGAVGDRPTPPVGSRG